jgi:selenocysteine lyase/cysteine desulfurase
VTVTYNVDRLRARMPALESGTAFFDGPGGTQTPDIVADVIASAMKGELANRARCCGSPGNGRSTRSGSARHRL